MSQNIGNRLSDMYIYVGTYLSLNVFDAAKPMYFFLVGKRKLIIVALNNSLEK